MSQLRRMRVNFDSPTAPSRFQGSRANFTLAKTNECPRAESGVPALAGQLSRPSQLSRGFSAQIPQIGRSGLRNGFIRRRKRRQASSTDNRRATYSPRCPRSIRDGGKVEVLGGAFLFPFSSSLLPSSG